ncbi:MAG: tRNA 2-selenouridine(34) synthase MnmH [Granulosicoccaceae bacterium]
MPSTVKANNELSNYRQLIVSRAPMIDVRSPIEYIEASAPGAVNIPLLDDQQRHLVGAEYKRLGRDAAIALGARLLDPQQRHRRIESWRAHAARHPNAAICCARGGMRSNISSSWLAEAGTDLPVVKGGYKAVRQFLLASLIQSVQQLPLIVVGGRTGIGKTIFLNTLERRLDLEGLAKHRGSSFGGTATPQPSNANFENEVAASLLRLVSTKQLPVFVEDEARMVGSNCVPAVLHEKMKVSNIILLEETLDARIDNVIDGYVVQLLSLYKKSQGDELGFDAYVEHHLNSLFRIRKRFGGENYEQARELLVRALAQHKNHNDTAAYKPLVEKLLLDYYDPMYDYQLQAKADRVLHQGDKLELAKWCKDSAYVKSEQIAYTSQTGCPV